MPNTRRLVPMGPGPRPASARYLVPGVRYFVKNWTKYVASRQTLRVTFHGGLSPKTL